MGPTWIVLLLFIATAAARPEAFERQARFLPGADKETEAKISEVIAGLQEKFGEVSDGFFDKLKESIIAIGGNVKDKVDSIISGVFDLFGKDKGEHELTPEEKAFRKKFNKVLEELKTKVPVKDRKRFLPGADKESKAKLDAAIAELKKKFGEVEDGFFDKLKENIKSIPGNIKEKVDSIISGIFDLFGGKKKTEHEISPEEKAFRKKFNKVLEELKTKVPVKERRFIPGADKETEAKINKVIAGLQEKFGEVESGFFDKLKENIKNIHGKVGEKIDSIISGIFDLFGKGSGEHEISAEEKAFRAKFNKVLEELKAKTQ